MAMPALKSGPPLHQARSEILRRIDSGEWKPGTRLPPETQLSMELGVSPRLVSDAIAELIAEQRLARINGMGVLVAQRRYLVDPQDSRDIAEQITARGGFHKAELVKLEDIAANAHVALYLDVPAGARVYHSVILHSENGDPLQVEDRFVNPVLAPQYMQLKFERFTPLAYLRQACQPDEVEQVIEAAAPDARARRLLRMEEAAPALLIRRRMFCPRGVASVVWLTYPGDRFRLGGRFRIPV